MMDTVLDIIGVLLIGLLGVVAALGIGFVAKVFSGPSRQDLKDENELLRLQLCEITAECRDSDDENEQLRRKLHKMAAILRDEEDE